jgi:putative PIN family toxin of toxin-antitoxin system
LISATLDSSVYVRALHFGGPAALLIGHARVGNIRIDISDPIINETMRVLRTKFQWNGYMIQDARGKLLSLGNHVAPTGALSVIKEDPDDDRILECAATAVSDFIVTEDKDLLRLSRFGNSRILTIREFLDLPLTQQKEDSSEKSVGEFRLGQLAK